SGQLPSGTVAGWQESSRGHAGESGLVVFRPVVIHHSPVRWEWCAPARDLPMNKVVSCCQASGRWLLGHPGTVLGILALGPLSISFCLRSDNEWEAVYLRTAAKLWRGGDIYDDTDGYLYPPFMAWAALPFLAGPPVVGRFGWLLVNIVSLVVILRGA